MIYKWRTSFPSHGVDAQVAGERLEEIRQRKALTAKAIVDDARPEESPLHPCFDWDDSSAAEKWREQQASALIREIVVTMETTHSKRDVRAFVSVNVNNSPQYTSIEAALSREDLRQQVLDAAVREIDGWRRKYRDLQELAEVVAAADRAVEKLTPKDSAERPGKSVPR